MGAIREAYCWAGCQGFVVERGAGDAVPPLDCRQERVVNADDPALCSNEEEARFLDHGKTPRVIAPYKCSLVDLNLDLMGEADSLEKNGRILVDDVAWGGKEVDVGGAFWKL